MRIRKPIAHQRSLIGLAILGALILASGTQAQETHDHSEHAHDQHAESPATQPASPETAQTNTRCPVMDLPVNPDISVQHEGKTVYFCCPACPERFLANPEQYLENLPQFNPETPTTQPASPETSAQLNTHCPVMNLPVNADVAVEYEGKTVLFCCAGCPERFLANPDQYVAGLPQFQTAGAHDQGAHAEHH